MPDVFVGVDLGTSALKCGAWDSAGRRRAFALSRAFPRAQEQDAEGWKLELERTLAQLVTELDGQPGQQIAALAVGGHAPSPVFCDAGSHALAPVSTWRDHRAQAQFDRLCELEPMLRAPSDDRLEAHLAAAAKRILVAQPTLATNVHSMLLSWEFLLAWLSGVSVTSTAATCDLAQLAGIPSWRPALRRGPGEIVGHTSKALASRTGLRAGTPVVVGGIDSWLASVGSGIDQLGQACINAGSAAIVAQLVPAGSIARFVLGELALVSEPVRLGGGLLDLLFEHQTPEQRHTIIGAATQLDGVLELPIELCGPSRTQIEQTLQTLAHAHGLAFACRAALVRMVLAQRRVLDIIGARFGAAHGVRMVGGLTADVRLRQLNCDALARPLELPVEHHASALGAAMLAAVGVNAFSSIGNAAAAMSCVRGRLTPRPDQDALQRAYEAVCLGADDSVTLM